ncbi:MAG: 3-methyl-2-oxobutanoate hydroxymethyltransferase [Actinobacteria bacterium]|nr:3-methyl-2-oxobutanoate hydroxymethyltransferase [Actinomycetota bacterium]
MGKVSLTTLRAMKASGDKIVGVVVWDYQMARIVDRADVEIISVGDTVGVNVWGHATPFEVTLDEMILVCRAVRRGVENALLSCDFPYGPVQQGVDAAVHAAVRLVKEAGVDLVKVDAAADYPEAVTAITRAGIPVFAQFGITPQTALRYGVSYSPSGQGSDIPAEMTKDLVAQAQQLEQAGAVLLNFTNSGPVAGPAVVSAVGIPVLGGFGGGPWLDGRMRMAHAAVGYSAAALDDPPDAYANVAGTVFDAIRAYADDVRSGRHIRGGVRVTATG